MTSNIGAQLIQSEMEKLDNANRDDVLENLQNKLFQLLKQQVRPEFLNRIDEVILFTPLSREDLEQIVTTQCNMIRKLANRQKINLNLEKDALLWLANAGFDPAFGARPLKRVMQRNITNRLSEMILEGTVQEGDTVNISIKNGDLNLEKTTG